MIINDKSYRGLDSEMVQTLAFLNLPKSIRRKIYKYPLVSRKPLVPLHPGPVTRYFKVIDEDAILLQAGLVLLRTCSTIAKEATRILYGKNIFRLCPNRIEQITLFLQRLPIAHLARVKFIQLDFELSRSS